MYVLVLWTQDKTTSVLKIKQLAPDKDAGEMTMAQSDGDELYECRIIKKSSK